jgi:hypothetical protein
MIIQLGNFEITSGKLAVSDPCYELNTDTIIMGVLDKVLNGTWVGQVEKTEVRDWGEACSKLMACHSSVTYEPSRMSPNAIYIQRVPLENGAARVYCISSE